MSYKDVDKFVRDHAKDAKLQAEFRATPDKALDHYPKLSADERSLLKRKNAMEIKTYLKDAYGSALQVNIP